MTHACKPCDGTYNRCRVCQGSEPNGWWSPEQAIRGQNMHGRTYMIVGANSGIGFVTAQTLLRAGADVIISTRSHDKTQKTISRLLDGLPLATGPRLKGVSIDLNSVESIRIGANEFVALGIQRLDAICFNAGVMGLSEFTETGDGLEMHWGINHVGQFHLFKLLLPTILQLMGHTRIVIVSSLAHQKAPNNFNVDTHLPPLREDYDMWRAYGISKLCNILTAREITRRLDGKGITAYSLHPGFVSKTSLYRHMSRCIPYLLDCCAYVHCCCLWYADYKTVRRGASTQLFLMTQPLDELQPGGYYAGCRLQNRSSVNYKYRLAENDKEAAKLWKLTEEIIAEKECPL